MKTAIAIIIVIIVIAAGYFLFFAKKAAAPTTNPATAGGTSAPLETTNPNAAAAGQAPASAQSVTVTYDGTSFSPASVSVKKGESVTFVDSTGKGFWVASNPHPVHTGYSGTSVSQHCPDTAGTAFDECSVGTSYTFTFQKVGSWGYHNHLNHSAGGTVVVAQ